MPLTWPPPETDPAHPNSAPSDLRKIILQEYSDHGQWARHYSTVRMTLGTFFVTAATGFISLRWDTPGAGVALIAAGIFFIGVILFLEFSWLTFHEMNKQRELVDTYSTVLNLGRGATSKFSLLRSGTGIVLVIPLIIAFAALDYWWYYDSKPRPKAVTEITVPLKLQVGNQPPTIVNVPLKVVLPDAR